MFQINKKVQAAAALAALSIAAAGCKSGPRPGDPGSKQYQASIEKARTQRPNFVKEFHPFHREDLEREFTARYNKAFDVNKSMEAVRLGVIKLISGKAAEAKSLLLEAVSKMEDANVSGGEDFLAKRVDLRNFANFRGDRWERAAARLYLSYALIALGDDSNARASLRGAIEHLNVEKKDLPKTEEQLKQEAAQAEANKLAEGESRVVEPEANRSSLGVYIGTLAAKLSVRLADPASAESYLNQARLFDAANQKAGLPGAAIPTLEELSTRPFFGFGEGMGPIFIRLGNSRQYREVVDGESLRASLKLSGPDGSQVSFAFDKPTADLTAEAKMAAKAEIDAYIEGRNARADDREIGFAFANRFYAVSPQVPNGETNFKFEASGPTIVGLCLLDGTGRFIREGGDLALTLTKDSIVVGHIAPDYPKGCDTKEQAAELNRKKGNERGVPSKGMRILNDVIRTRR